MPAHLQQRGAETHRGGRTGEGLGAAFDDPIDRVARELEDARADLRGVRGDRRRQLVDRLTALDRELLEHARASLDEPARRDGARGRGRAGAFQDRDDQRRLRAPARRRSIGWCASGIVQQRLLRVGPAKAGRHVLSVTGGVRL